MHEQPQADPLETLVAWAEAQPAIRAVILTSSRARPQEAIDLLSDYDVILVVTDADRFAREDAWISAYAESMVRWSDQQEIYGLTTYFHGVVYANRIKVDYTVWPVALLERISAANALLD